MTQKHKIIIIGLIINIILGIIKLIAGIYSSSIALISDAVNSFMDVVTHIIIFYSLKISSKKPDKSHPFGHSRAEPLAALFVATLAGIVGFEIIRNATTALIYQQNIIDYRISYQVFLVVVISIIAKIILAVYYQKIGSKQNSRSLLANSIDARNDVLATSLVLIALVFTYFNLIYFDIIIAVLMGLFIIYSGYSIARENLSLVMGHSLDQKIVKKIKKEIDLFPKVKNSHNYRSQYIGNDKLVSFHITVNNKMSIDQANQIKQKLINKINKIGIKEVFIHIDSL